MACNTCKNKGKTNSENNPEEKFNVAGNIAVRIFLFMVIVGITPLLIPFIWYFTFIKLFMENKSLDLFPSLLALSQRFLNKKNDDEDEDIDEDFDVEDLELVTQIDEIEK